jgi:hypothetical protein
MMDIAGNLLCKLSRFVMKKHSNPIGLGIRPGYRLVWQPRVTPPFLPSVATTKSSSFTYSFLMSALDDYAMHIIRRMLSCNASDLPGVQEVNFPSFWRQI